MNGEWRFEVRLRSREALVTCMALHQPPLSVRKLAEKCDPERKERHRPAIGHLVSGARQTCSAELAKHIQEILGSARVQLFEGDLYRVAGDSTTARRGSRAA